jgi:hypothetical protein
MNRNLLMAEVRGAILATLAARGTPLPVRQDYQPTAQGLPTDTVLLVHYVTDRRYGFTKRAEVWDEVANLFVRRQAQQIETTLQLSVAGPQSPADTTGPTLLDWAQRAAMALGSDDCLARLQAANIGMTRIRDVRMVYAVDDRDQHEGSPSFDAVFTHRDIVTDTLPSVTDYDVVIDRV